jgi:hypothetical protein
MSLPEVTAEGASARTATYLSPIARRMIARRPLRPPPDLVTAPHFVEPQKTHLRDRGAYVFVMTDSAAGAAPPPKKKFTFKKAAWQTAPQAEEKEQVDIFSHSNEFRDIVAEQTRRKEEEKKKKAEEARKRKADEERERKRQRVSTEAHERIPGSGSANSTRESRLSSKGYSSLHV